jgi:threonine/homoserine/homoserine lactone efflux protein
MNFDILLGFISAVSLLAISPGPDNIFVLMQSVVHGRKYGLATVAGLMSGCIIHTTLVAFGVSAIIKENESIFLAIKVLGAAYLFYLAYKVLRSSGAIAMDGSSVQKKTTAQLFKTGFLMNVLNPKVTIFFLALFPGFLFSDTLSEVVQFYVLGGLFIAMSAIIFSAIALLGGSISAQIQQNKKIGIWLKWLQIVVFVGIAVFVLL